MGFDIRVPLGVMFALIGALLAGYGVMSDPAMNQRSLGININPWWALGTRAGGELLSSDSY